MIKLFIFVQKFDWISLKLWFCDIHLKIIFDVSNLFSNCSVSFNAYCMDRFEKLICDFRLWKLDVSCLLWNESIFSFKRFRRQKQQASSARKRQKPDDEDKIEHIQQEKDMSTENATMLEMPAFSGEDLDEFLHEVLKNCIFDWKITII